MAQEPERDWLARHLQERQENRDHQGLAARQGDDVRDQLGGRFPRRRQFFPAAVRPQPPQRQLLYRELSQLIAAYNPWVLLTHPISADLQQPWLKNYQRHPVELTPWRYLDVDVDARKRNGRFGATR